jgi:hypothetical protein
MFQMMGVRRVRAVYDRSDINAQIRFPQKPSIGGYLEVATLSLLLGSCWFVRLSACIFSITWAGVTP